MVKKSKSKPTLFLKNIKRGALSRQLGIAERDDIPMTLIRMIIRAKIGMLLRNPTKTGKLKIRITKLLIRRAILARTLKRFAMARRKKK